jgi:N-acetylglutamate synthase/N-acetylornithine aminotransferase
VLPPYLRQKLTDFYAGVARQIAEDEEAVHARMEVMVASAPSLPGSNVAR